MKKKMFALAAAIATVFATTIATSACFWYFYQPEEPDCLKDRQSAFNRMLHSISTY